MAIRMPDKRLSPRWGDQSLSACIYSSYTLRTMLFPVAHRRVGSAHSPAELHFATSVSHLRGFPVPRAARTLARGRRGGKDSIGSSAEPLMPGGSRGGAPGSDATRSLLATTWLVRDDLRPCLGVSERGPARRPSTLPNPVGAPCAPYRKELRLREGLSMKWLARFGLALALAAGAQGARAAPARGAEPSERSFRVWHGSRPSAWTLLTAPPRRGPPQSAPPMGLSEEISGSKPVLWSLRAPPVGPGPALAPVESFASVCPGTKPVAESLSMDHC
jgi:hypothetical protein